MTYPITAPASGAYPISTTWGATGTFANTDQNNTNGVANYAWGGVDTAPTTARVATVGTETYTIVSGSVTLISGTTIDGVTTAVNDIVLVKDAPASTGTGSVGSSQPGNGLYTVTGLSGGTQVARTATQSSGAATQAAGLPSGGPAGRVVFVRPGGTANGTTMWQVVSPFAVAAFTYGTTAMQWRQFSISNAANPQAGINNFNFAVQSQAAASTTAYYITNSGLKMPAVAITGMTANKTAFVWNVVMVKTAAGTGAFQIILYRGANGTTADTADQTVTIGTSTAAADTLTMQVQIVITIVGGSGVGAYYYVINADNRAGAGVGFGISGTAGSFTGTTSSVATNTASLIFGLGFEGAVGTPTITVPMVQAFAYNMN
jgi:hypothetical protein